MNNGIVLAFLAYAIFAWGDALVKSMGGELPVFEIAFFVTIFAAVPILLTKHGNERWLEFWRMKRPAAVHLRAASGVTAGMLGVYAFTTIPFAEAYALIFLSPLLVTVLSMLMLKEDVGPWRWFAVFAGLAGVLLVVRPGFRELQIGHFAAVGVALLAALTIILLRSLAGQEKRTTLLGTMIVYGLVINGIAMVATGFTVPDASQLARLATAGVLAGVGQFALLAATKITPANQIAPTHYSQIAWAVLIGALFFDEYPDVFAIAGLVALAAAGLLTVIRERIRLGAARWNPFLRNRL
ncbi:MAG: DMT family transporter [Rhizobiaceae bacterium]|nr:DMT family transporter [Rhizobiaceae bacterium]